MAMLNIPSTVDDPSYRYKMPRLQSRTESRGNGVKTNVVNCAEVASALRRPPTYLTKFFGSEIGAQATFAVKDKGQPPQCIIMGKHSQDDLQDLVDRFIATFVLCPKCKLPEADIVIKAKDIHGKCKACGFAGVMPEASVHKMQPFVVKNPPGSEFEQEAGDKDKKAARRAEKAEKQRALAAGEGGDAGDDGDSEEAQEKKKKKKKKDKGEEGDAGVEKKKKKKKDKGEEGDAGVEKKKKKKKEKEEAADDDGSAEEDESPHVVLAITKLREEVSAPPDDFMTSLREVQVAKDFDPVTRTYVLFEALFGEDGGSPLTPSSVKDKMATITTCVKGYKSPITLQALEKYLEVHGEVKLAKVCHELFNADVLEDAAVLQRYREVKGSGAGYKLLQAQLESSGFLDWLDDSDDSDSDSD